MLVDTLRKAFELSQIDPITSWITDLKGGDPEAAAHLWGRFSRRVEGVARKHLDEYTRRTYDEQDAANSAFHSLCRGISEGRFGAIDDRDNFWRLLAVIASRKVTAQQRAAYSQKRGGGAVHGDSVFLAEGLKADDFAASREPSPEFAAEVADSCKSLLHALDDVDLQQIALFKFEGFTNGEIAEKVKRTRRTIERKLEMIRRCWIDKGLVKEDVDTVSNQ